MSDRSEPKVDVVEVMGLAMYANRPLRRYPGQEHLTWEEIGPGAQLALWSAASAALAALEEKGLVVVPRESTSAVEALRALSDEGRMEVMAHFCKHCGSDNPGCQCWNDE